MSATLDSLNQSQLSSSFGSMVDHNSGESTHSTKYILTSRRRRPNFFSRVGASFQTLLRRFTYAPRSLNDMEMQILSTITNFTREEIIQW